VRTRAGQKPIPPGLSQEQLRDRIRNERSVELAFENHRFWDVRRWKIAPETQVGIFGMRPVRDANTPTGFRYETLTSGNDAADRDPKAWTLEGSSNGTTWTVLDTRSNEAFANRLMTKTYFFQNSTAYTHYRLSITENNGGGLFQMTEWRLLTAAPPTAPTGLEALAPAGTEVVLTWNDLPNSEEGFDLESSTDGTTWTVLTSTENNVNTYTHTGLNVSSKYYYRVTAKNIYGKSAYTNTAEVTTLTFPEPLVDLTNNGGLHRGGRQHQRQREFA
jgi:hypothetical protein